MSVHDAAICKLCGHVAPKVEMERIRDGSMVTGYKHKDCSRYADYPTEIKQVARYERPQDSIRDMHDWRAW